ncbi:MAG: ATPase, T2SS/T4P/T4SS family [Desulfatibacillaceae bacterium]
MKITDKIHSAGSVDEILYGIPYDIASHMDARRCVVYLADSGGEELLTRIKDGPDVRELRLPVAETTPVGLAAIRSGVVNITDASNEQELASLSPALTPLADPGENTPTQILAAPIVFGDSLLGVLEVAGCRGKDRFDAQDEARAREIAQALSVAIHTRRTERRKRPGKFDYLLENHMITPSELDRAATDARAGQVAVESVLLRQYGVSKRDLLTSLAEYYQTAYEVFDETAPPDHLLRNLKASFMRGQCFVPLREDNGEIVVAVDNPQDVFKHDLVKSLFPGKPIRFHVATPDDVHAFIRRFSREQMPAAGIDEILEELAEEDGLDRFEEEEELSDDERATAAVVNKLINDAVARGATHMHVEPQPDGEATRIRVRIDGECALLTTIPAGVRDRIVSRLKRMAGAEPGLTAVVQQGEIRYSRYGGANLGILLQTVPMPGHDEAAVLHFLDAKAPSELGNLDMPRALFREVSEMLARPHGLVAVCTPGSADRRGLLGSVVTHASRPSRKVWAVGRHTEEQWVGVAHVLVDPLEGLDYGVAMEAVLHADPDVVVVGEVRDSDSAACVTQACRNGVLVVTAVQSHCPGLAVSRLLSEGIPPNDLSDYLLGILARHLVRGLCPDCKIARTPDDEQWQALVAEYGIERVKEDVGARILENPVVYEASGCEKCSGTGFAGRVPVYEYLGTTPRIRELVAQTPSGFAIRKLALGESMRTGRQDVIRRVFQGLTAMSEMDRLSPFPHDPYTPTHG